MHPRLVFFDQWTDPVAGEQKFLPAFIPHGESKHPMQMFRRVVAVRFISMDDGFRIAAGIKAMAFGFKVGAQFRDPAATAVPCPRIQNYARVAKVARYFQAVAVQVVDLYVTDRHSLDRRDEIVDMNLLTRMGKQIGDVLQSLHVLQPNEAVPIGDRPVLPLSAEPIALRTRDKGGSWETLT